MNFTARPLVVSLCAAMILMLAGAPIAGAYDAVQPGHGINNKLVRALLANPSAWCWEEAGARAEAAGDVRAAV